jgi:hypothetical protein
MQGSGVDSSVSTQGHLHGFFECGDEHLGRIKNEKFHDDVKDSQILKKGCV